VTDFDLEKLGPIFFGSGNSRHQNIEQSSEVGLAQFKLARKNVIIPIWHLF
jgi:hypothetical protein